MPYVGFHEHFPEIARRETRTVTLLASSPFKLPPGEYALLEMYCDEPECDCRRVFFYVVSSRSSRTPEAVVAYGWEPAEFYAKWARQDDPEVVQNAKGPVLNLASPQSERAPEILRLIEEVVLQDPRYVGRIRAHYGLFRRHIDGDKKSAGKHRGSMRLRGRP